MNENPINQSLDFKQMQYILTIASEQNITHAADKLFITRSALNYSLLNLEKQLGFPLFKRLTGKLVPTYAGELYLEQARQILASCHELSHTMEVLSDSTHGRLNIGLTVGGGQQIFMDVFPDFHRKYPDITVNMIEGNGKTLEQALLDGQIDIAWVGFRTKNPLIDYLLIRPGVDLKLAVPKNHPAVLRHRLDQYPADRSIDLSLFRDDYFILMNAKSFIRSRTDEIFHLAGFQPKVMMECSIMSMVVRFVKENIALAFVPDNHQLSPDQAYLFPVEPRHVVFSTILYRKGTLFTEPENDLIRLIVERDKLRAAGRMC